MKIINLYFQSDLQLGLREDFILKKDKVSQSTLYAIGDFDGVHLGHANLINATRKLAQQLQVEWGLICFNPNTKSWFNQDYRILTSLEQKLIHFKQLQVPNVVIVNFSHIYEWSFSQFVRETLLKKLKAVGLVAGKNCTIGSDLFSLCNPNNPNYEFITINDTNYYKLVYKTSTNDCFNCYTIDLTNNNQSCLTEQYLSASGIKSLINQGKLALANSKLGHNFMIKSQVINGNKLGRTLGFPTINVLCSPYVVPKYGVYASKTHLDNGLVLDSVSSFGIRPTIKETSKQEILETFIFNFNQDLYHQMVEIEMVEYIREELKFNNLEELITNIKLDIVKAQEILAKRKNYAK